MEYLEKLMKPTKEEQKVALESYNTLSVVLKALHSVNPEIEIEESEQKIKIPLSVLKLLVTILKATSQGNPISIVPIATEITTQAASEILGCSRPYLVSLLEKGEIEYIKVGRHRRLKYEDVISYKNSMKANQKALLIELMKGDEDLGLYDS
jgi:excisionase family DNA binding protein